MTSPKISIITLTYNGIDVLKNCVESILEKCATVDFEWLIRENGSKDGSLEYLQQMAAKDSRLRIFNMTNGSNFSQMNNELYPECRGQYVVFLNNDVEAITDFLSVQANILDRDPKVGGVGAVLWYPNKTLQHCGIAFEHNCSAHNISNQYSQLRNLYNGLHLKDRVYQAATGACFMMRKDEWKAIGLFDEGYVFCFDDVALSLSITHKLKKKIVVPKDAQLFHFESYSKANPNTWAAWTRLKSQWGKIFKPDVFNYSIDSNVYVLPE